MTKADQDKQQKAVTSHEATVVASERITPETSDEEVRELVIDVDQPDAPFHVGQSIGVLAPVPGDSGEPDHLRYYSLADVPGSGESGKARITICVRRTIYKEGRGEERKGVASNYLCDLRPGDQLAVTPPIGLPFEVPAQRDANLVLIGTGTGIGPFRAFIKHLYRNVPDWTGRVLLFHGARRGVELLYMNDEKDDFAQYFDRETFEAFKALSPRLNWADPLAWDQAFAERGEELWKLLADEKTYVYVAGQEKMREGLDAFFATCAGSQEDWERHKTGMVAAKRWVELLY